MSEVTDLAESSMAMCAGNGRMFDLKLNFISSHDGTEDLSASARVIHTGRRTIVTDCRIQAPDGRLVATASATFAITQEKE